MKKYMTGFMVLLLVIVMAVSVSAINIVKPAAGLRDVCGSAYNFSADIATAGSSNNVSFYWNNSGTLTALCSVNNATIKDGTSYSCSGSTTGITDGAANIVAIARNATSLSIVEQNLSAVLEVDNAGPVISFAAANTADKATMKKAGDLAISVTTDEVMTAGYVVFGGERYVLSGTDTTTFTYDFSDDEFAEGTYTYQVIGGTDNTTCVNAATGASRTFEFDDSSSAKVGYLTDTVGDSQSVVGGTTGGVSNKYLILAVVAILTYLLFFNKKRRR